MDPRPGLNNETSAAPSPARAGDSGRKTSISYVRGILSSFRTAGGYTSFLSILPIAGAPNPSRIPIPGFGADGAKKSY